MGRKTYSKRTAKNFPKLGKEIDTQIQEAKLGQKKMNPKGPTWRHIIIKLLEVKNKERILKAARQK